MKRRPKSKVTLPQIPKDDEKEDKDEEIKRLR